MLIMIFIQFTGQRCPPPVSKPVSFAYGCTSQSYFVGTICVAGCTSGFVGTTYKTITCVRNGNNDPVWDGSFDDVQCIPRRFCPGRTRFCNPSPCEEETCPGVVNSQCVNNNCGGCEAEFYENGQTFNKLACQIRGNVIKKQCCNWLFVNCY